MCGLLPAAAERSRIEPGARVDIVGQRLDRRGGCTTIKRRWNASSTSASWSPIRSGKTIDRTAFVGQIMDTDSKPFEGLNEVVNVHGDAAVVIGTVTTDPTTNLALGGRQKEGWGKSDPGKLFRESRRRSDDGRNQPFAQPGQCAAPPARRALAGP